MAKKEENRTSLKTELHTNYIHENLLLLRRRLMLSQREFIEKYLSDENSMPLISVPKLSNVENKGSKDSESLASIIAEKMVLDVKIFQLPPDDFAKNIDLFIESHTSTQGKELSDIAQMVKKTSYVETLVHVISDYLADSIISGDLKGGDKLPSDRNLAMMFNVGRTSIREALKVLSVLGLITILPGQGTFVASDSTEFFLTPLSWTFLMGEKNVDNVINVRNVLEAESARLSALHATKEDLDALTVVFNQFKNAYTESNFQVFLDLDLDFHLTIAKCSHNPILYNLLLTSRKLIRHISKSGMVSLDDLGLIYEEHSQIYHAIVALNSPQACHVMQDHLEKSYKRYHLQEK